VEDEENFEVDEDLENEDFGGDEDIGDDDIDNEDWGMTADVDESIKDV
jgi:hypothetical protein